jgi:hypothetical protein
MELKPFMLEYKSPDNARLPCPANVSVVAWVMIALGLLGMVEMIWRFVQGSWSINLGVLSVVLGRGLLRGSESWRKWTLRYVIFSGLFLVGSVFVVLWAPKLRMTLTLAGHRADDLGRAGALAAIVVSLIICGFAAHVLTRAEVRAWFHARSRSYLWTGSTR